MKWNVARALCIVFVVLGGSAKGSDANRTQELLIQAEEYVYINRWSMAGKRYGQVQQLQPENQEAASGLLALEALGKAWGEYAYQRRRIQGIVEFTGSDRSPIGSFELPGNDLSLKQRADILDAYRAFLSEQARILAKLPSRK